MAKIFRSRTLGLVGLIAAVGCGGGIDEGVPAGATINPDYQPSVSAGPIKKSSGSPKRATTNPPGAPASN